MESFEVEVLGRFDDVGAALDEVAGWIRAAERIVVVSGAGISTDSGIPDFRGPNGVWTKNPAAEKLSTIEHYLADPEVRRRAWQSRLDSPAWAAAPNDGHLAVAALAERGQLLGVVTQNVDGLHQRAGVADELVLEVHGTIWFTRCWDCGDRRDMAETLQRVRDGEADPACQVCGGILKSDTISFGQNLVPEVIEAAGRVSAACDLMLAVGSTLSVYPAAGCVPTAVRAGARLVIVNGGPTEMDSLADAVLRGPIGMILPAIVGH